MLMHGRVVIAAMPSQEAAAKCGMPEQSWQNCADAKVVPGVVMALNASVLMVGGASGNSLGAMLERVVCHCWCCSGAEQLCLAHGFVVGFVVSGVMAAGSNSHISMHTAHSAISS